MREPRLDGVQASEVPRDPLTGDVQPQAQGIDRDRMRRASEFVHLRQQLRETQAQALQLVKERGAALHRCAGDRRYSEMVEVVPLRHLVGPS